MRRARATTCLPTSVSCTFFGWRSTSFDSEVVLELPDLSRQRRLADEGALRRPAEMAGIGERHQVLQVPEIHLRSVMKIDTVYQII